MWVRVRVLHFLADCVQKQQIIVSETAFFSQLRVVLVTEFTHKLTQNNIELLFMATTQTQIHYSVHLDLI